MGQLPIDDHGFLESNLSKASTFAKLSIPLAFITSALILILPLTALAAPSPAPASAIDPAAAIPISDAAKSRIAALSDDEIFTKRNTEVCEIINVSSYVYCRSGPGTGYSAEYELYGGYTWGFTCYEEGTCVDGNCTWDWNADLGCFVSGYYTSAGCSKANLGLC
ncbi:hypothetical protein EYB25_005833 [Talaromyces marneffei]|uniref:MBL2-like secreted peptide, putative n=1 Tax=Talaromyces marneffei (strain ATCC 18224 / CBS 334.59 / QM 7333) TaxID=441960 RepID=B6QI84_TALMQ|nr:uncharacterized protein EYB26_006873 [Talaromyces marneffei]EEA23079.1 MBL2-like secreted peptide, putative [Talaromyces marneffei ATCC 18224]KAE8551942.1 hypothetical protein EYB25_005833 [Talaromyces marneffei]QGA19185.1 hypothetical protein EYB26_006873 [Talaromyces marneffei]